jgi:putative redox protein
MSFENAPGSPAITLHSSTPGVPSPPEALAYAVMACMGMDIVHVITKGRHRLEGMTIRFEGERAAEPPRRYVMMTMVFEVTTSAEARIVERAITLSREKYCSVLHTLRPDIDLSTTFAIVPIPPADPAARRD